MVASRWFLFLAYPHAVGAAECLVGCLVQGISPFDDENLAVWDDRRTCDSTTVGCDVSAINYPTHLFKGALWASTSGTEGSSACTCSICDPYPSGYTTSYMSTISLWSRIHCYIAASEASGYDVSPCVAAVVDTGTLPCVDDVYEAPTVDQFDCDENRIDDVGDYGPAGVCIWGGDVRMAKELFPATPASSSTTTTSAVVNTNSCLVGCLVQGISPFDDENLAVWDNRGTCDSTTIGCEVSAINYPTFLFKGALWASSWGTEGSSDCACNICDPYPSGYSTSYMSEISLWSRIHCYLVATEASGYDVSPCVAAIMDTGTLPCVDDVYEMPTVGQFDCEQNDIDDLGDYSPAGVCIWYGTPRSTDELFSGTRAPSPLPAPTPAPAPTTSGTDILDNLTPVPSSTHYVTPQPDIARTDPPDPTPTTPSATPLPSANGPQSSTVITISPDSTPAATSATSPPSANGPQRSTVDTIFPDSIPASPSVTSPPSAGGSTVLLELEGGGACAVGSTCQDDYCCHPDTNTCGRKHTFCQKRDFADGPRCCSGVEDDPAESNVCSEDSVCDEPDGLTRAEVAGIYIGIVTGVISIIVAIWKGYQWWNGKR